jgi:hypothetical protein
MEKNPRPGLRGDCTRKLFTIFVILTVTVLYSSFSRPVSSAAINPPAGMPAYKNPSFTIDKRVEDLPFANDPGREDRADEHALCLYEFNRTRYT